MQENKKKHRKTYEKILVETKSIPRRPELGQYSRDLNYYYFHHIFALY